MNGRNDSHCGWLKEDCFAYKNGWCGILTDTNLKGRTKCPFYKTKARVALERLKENVRDDKGL